MKRMIAAAALLLSAVAVSVAAENPKVTFVGHDQAAKPGTLVTAPNLSILMAHRDAPGMVEIHDKETDTIYVLGGSATFVTGGTMIGGSYGARPAARHRHPRRRRTPARQGRRDRDPSRRAALVQRGARLDRLLRREGHRAVTTAVARLRRSTALTTQRFIRDKR